jgi:hypothetical protein
MIGSGCGVCVGRGGFGDNRGSERLGKLADACQTWGSARRRTGPGSFVPAPRPTPCRAARMQDKYPAESSVRLCRVCDDGQISLGSGRLFVCVRCGCQVVVCRGCDRGQIYCDGDCSRQARRQTLHGAGRRWQRSSRGRRMHAARMGRYRAKLAKSSDGVGGMPNEGWPQKIVTHHGSPPPPVDDLLAGGATAMPRDDASPAEPPGRAMTHCYWCGRCCLLPLRLGFLRRCDHRRGGVGQARTECKSPW